MMPGRHRTSTTLGRHGALAARAAMTVILMTMGGCAANPRPSGPSAPLYPDFVYPASPAPGAKVAGPDAIRFSAELEQAWQVLQRGDLRSAERQFTALAARGPAYFPADVGLGYVNVAERRYEDALVRFNAVLVKRPQYAAAHAGRGEALAGMSRLDDAIAAFEAALAADPALAEVRRRIAVMRFGGVQRLVDSARKAAGAGRGEEARRLYEQAIAASPESPVLYRELAAVELSEGAPVQAVVNLRRATTLDPGDARSWLTLGEALEKVSDVGGATEAYKRALNLDPLESTRKALDRLSRGTSEGRSEPELRGVLAAPAITRADLAALVGSRFGDRLARAVQPVGKVITDAGGHWASRWIFDVTRAGVMDVYPNHTFQPLTVVRRIELAAVVQRLLRVLGPVPIEPLRHGISDVPPGHLGYPAVSAAVASGAMTLLERGSFEPSRPVSGREASGVLDRLDRLLGSARRIERTPGR